MGMLRPWLPALVIVTLVATAKLYDGVTGGSWLDLFFEPPVKPPVWAPFKPEQVRSDDPEFLRGVAAYDRQSLAEAYAIWLPLAEAGDAEAQYQVGRLLERGWGVEEDDKVAAGWFTRATAQEHAWAQSYLGYLHRYGRGVPQDHELATELYRKAMLKGNKTATFSYALALLNGRGIDTDQKSAFSIFSELQAAGYCRANYILGSYYWEGFGGIEVDLEKSYRLYKVAQAQGCDSEAARTLLRWKLDSRISTKVDGEFE